MRIILNLSLVLLPLISHQNKAFSLSNHKIKEICQKYRREYKCIRDLKLKRIELLKGNKIEIPVIPYRK